MLQGHDALIALLATVACIVFVIAWLKRLAGRVDKAKRAAEAAFLAGLARRQDIDEADKDGLTPLLRSLIEGWDTALTRVLDRRPDPNRPTPTGDTALHLLARRGDVDLVHRLLGLGAHADTRNHAGETPLWTAAGAGSADIVTRLAQAGADLEITDLRAGHTPLMIAALQGRCEAVARLLELGADPTRRDPEGRTAADLGEAALGRNMGAFVDANHALQEMVARLRARESGHAYVPRQRTRAGDEHAPGDADE